LWDTFPTGSNIVFYRLLLKLSKKKGGMVAADYTHREKYMARDQTAAKELIIDRIGQQCGSGDISEIK